MQRALSGELFLGILWSLVPLGPLAGPQGAPGEAGLPELGLEGPSLVNCGLSCLCQLPVQQQLPYLIICPQLLFSLQLMFMLSLLPYHAMQQLLDNPSNCPLFYSHSHPISSRVSDCSPTFDLCLCRYCCCSTTLACCDCLCHCSPLA